MSEQKFIKTNISKKKTFKLTPHLDHSSLNKIIYMLYSMNSYQIDNENMSM